MTNHVIVLSAGEFVIKNCLLSYPHLFEPRRAGKPGKPTGDPKFSADFILPADLSQIDMDALRQLWADAISYKWPGTPPAGLPQCFEMRERVSPWKNAAQTDPSLANRLRLASNTGEKSPPRVLQEIGPRMYEPITDQSKIFAGCIVNAHLRFFGFDTGSNGVSCALQGVLLVSNVDVQRLDNRTDSADAFAQAEDGAGAPTGYPQQVAPPPPPGTPPGVPASQQTAPPPPAAPSYLD